MSTKFRLNRFSRRNKISYNNIRSSISKNYWI